MKPKHPKKYAAVLRKAAELIHDESQNFACCAIDAAHLRTDYTLSPKDGYHTDVEEYFHDWLKPKRAGKLEPYYGQGGGPENREARILGLLLMALLAEKEVSSP